MNDSPSLPHKPWIPFLILGALWVLIALIVIPTWGWTYWDFGDGNYMYIARRVREGLTLYKEILAPQPPLHTYAGVVAQAAGEAIFDSALIGVRAYCLLVRYAASLFVMLIALKFFRCPFRAVTAAAIYLFLPIGFWWSLGYQSENLEIVFLLAAIYLFLDLEKKPMAAAGALLALAAHTNMTAAPYFVVFAIFLGFRRWQLLPWFAGGFVVVYGIIAAIAQVATDGYFLSNVVFNQVGTFPRADILTEMRGEETSLLDYAWEKITSEGWKVLELEGELILAALIAMALKIARARPEHEGGDEDQRRTWLRAEFLIWAGIGMMLSICFTAKGGTVNYIFVLGEPAVALFAADALVRFWRLTMPRPPIPPEEFLLVRTKALLQLILPVAVTVLVFLPAYQNIKLTLSEAQVELPEARVQELQNFILTYAEPGDTILAPPFYAFATGTNVAGELAENYIWNIKYLNETFDAEHYGEETGEAVLKMQEIAIMLREREIPVVLLDLNQTGRIPEIRQAIEVHYQPVLPEPYRTRNVQLGLYVPKGVEIGDGID